MTLPIIIIIYQVPLECRDREAKFILEVTSNETRTSQPVSVKPITTLEVDHLVKNSDYSFRVLSLNSIGKEQSQNIFFCK